MSLYTYVPGKTEPCNLMLDNVYLAMPRPPFVGRDWRAKLTQVADDNRSLLLAHPWAAALTTPRPPLGPGLMAKYDHELTAFDGLGLDDATTDDALTYLLTFVQAARRRHGRCSQNPVGQRHERRAVVGGECPLLVWTASGQSSRRGTKATVPWRTVCDRSRYDTAGPDSPGWFYTGRRDDR